MWTLLYLYLMIFPQTVRAAVQGKSQGKREAVLRSEPLETCTMRESKKKQGEVCDFI